MPVDINGVNITGGTSLSVTDASSNTLFQQTSAGIVLAPRTSAGATLTPLFNVGLNNTASWVGLTAGVWNILPFAYTGGNGYMNVGSCYNTTNYRFTAPWTGLYIFKMHLYHYHPNAGVTYYIHPQFGVNASVATRRVNTNYRIRSYGVEASYGADSDCCELIYLTAGDYVNAYGYVGTGMQYYGQYCSWSGALIGT